MTALSLADYVRLARALRRGTLPEIRAAQEELGVGVDGIVGGGTRGALDARRPLIEVCFPFDHVPAQRYDTGMRAFGAKRGGGARAHAGSDLYAKRGTAVHAVADGVVSESPSPFYEGTWEVTVDHGAFLARYCEIEPDADVREGDVVKRGQVIAHVGRMKKAGLPNGGQMLHFELFGNTVAGSLTQEARSRSAIHAPTGRPFKRRKDLLDGRPLLRLMERFLPR